MAVTE